MFKAREPFSALGRISCFATLQKPVFKDFWILAQDHCQNNLFSRCASHFSLWVEYLVLGPSRRLFSRISGSWPKTIARTAHFQGARAIFRSGSNIWFWDPPEDCFQAFLDPGPKPLLERLIFKAREPFFALDRISGFGILQKPVFRVFWILAQNHCQNGLFSRRASKCRPGSNIWFWDPP